MNPSLDLIKQEVIELLKTLISTESFSREEDQTAQMIYQFFEKKGCSVFRKDNNVWSVGKNFDASKKTILLNSHHDTVKPGKSWTYDPFSPTLEEDKLTGLGSNDAGGPAMALLGTYLYLEQKDLPYNLICAITAEEEISGAKNVASILEDLGTIDLAIVGEPTQMDMAIAERGLVVLDVEVYGKTGHAARKEGVNAIYEALKVMDWFKTYEFEKSSDFLGPVKMTVTQVESGKQHNVVPDLCKLVVDTRVNEMYSNTQVVEIIQKELEKFNCKATPRSTRLNSSRIDQNHPIVSKGKQLGMNTYGSPTISDQCVMNFDTIKIGPGDSARSHTPNEYIYLSEIREGIEKYVKLLEDFRF